MNQLPENSLRRYDVTSVTSYLIGLRAADNPIIVRSMDSELLWD